MHFFQEFSRRQGDYAIVGLASQGAVIGDRFADLRLSFFAVGAQPVLAEAAGQLIDVEVTPAVLSEACSALGKELDPLEDHQSTPAMRRHLAKVLLKRCVSALLDRAELAVGEYA